VNAREVLRIPDYRRIWVAQTISDFGDGLTNLALLIVVNALTGSTAAIALMAIAIAIPPMTIGLVAGVYVDRLDRRRVMLASDLLRAGLVLGLVLVRSADQLPLLYALAFLEASVGTFFHPARSALVPAIVPEDGLLAANGVSQASRVIASTAGAAAAGVLLGVAGTATPAFVVDSATFLVSFAIILGVRARPAPILPPSGSHAGIGLAFREGIATVARSRVLVGVLVAAAVLMLGLGAVNVLFIPLLRNDLGVPVTWLGAVDIAQTSSMVLSAGLVGVLAARLRPTSIVTATLAGLAGLICLVAFVTQVWQVILLLFLAGWLITPLNAAIMTLVQTESPPDRIGRVDATLNAALSGASIASMAAAGVLGTLIGVRETFLLAGLIAGLSAVVALVLFRGTAAAGAPSPAVPEGEPTSSAAGLSPVPVPVEPSDRYTGAQGEAPRA